VRVSRVLAARWTVAVGVSAAILAIVITLASGHVRYQLGDAVFLAANITGLSLAAAMWLVKRPASWLGVALGFYAATVVLVSLQSADEPLVYSLGVLADWPATLATFYVLVSFPTGRLTDRAGWLVMGIVMAVLAMFFLPYVLLSPSITGGHPLAECSSACPSNPLQVGTISADTLLRIGKLESIGAVVAGVLLCGILLRELITASRPHRRLVVWVAASGLLYGGVFAFRQLTAYVITAPDGVTETARWTLAVVRTLMPWAFVASIIHAEVFAGGVFARLMHRLADRPTLTQWEREMGRALDDPRLRLAFWAPARDGYVTTDRSIVEPTRVAPLSWLAIDRAGAPVGGIVHDPALEGDPELLCVAVKATLVAHDTDHMDDQMRNAAAHALAAGADERRRLERDLHDGTQQQLIALRIKLGLAAASDEPASRQLFEELGADVDESLADLRRLAHGIYPPLLADEGLLSALRAAARRSVMATEVICDRHRRVAQTTESGVYFACLEALQNAAKHAGDGATVTIRLDISDDSLTFSVQDNGRGFRPQAAHAGAGLGNMRDRITALDGHIEIRSNHRGTTITGIVPVAERPA
jgi:signal transduction histidine kinase